jgi:hypothetical protein
METSLMMNVYVLLIFMPQAKRSHTEKEKRGEESTHEVDFRQEINKHKCLRRRHRNSVEYENWKLKICVFEYLSLSLSLSQS